MEAVRKPLLLFAGFSIERFTIVRGADVVPPRFAGSRIHSVLSPRPQCIAECELVINQGNSVK